MTIPINMTLYRLLVKHGASEAEAEEAAKVDASQLATKSDLDKLEASLIKWGVALLFTALSIHAALIIFAVSRLIQP